MILPAETAHANDHATLAVHEIAEIPRTTKLSAWRTPLPAMARKPLQRWGCRAVGAVADRIIIESSGIEHIKPAGKPFIFVANHSQKLEALLLPAWLALRREGRQVHFMVDWNFLLWPGLGFLIRLNEPIVVMRKPARPAFLNIFRPLYASPVNSMAMARQYLREGRSIGIFPEGTRGQGSDMLQGSHGAARLAIETGANIVPAGLQFPRGTAEFAPIRLRIGQPMNAGPGPATRACVREFHSRIMSEISGLCGKQWSPDNPKTKYETGS